MENIETWDFSIIIHFVINNINYFYYYLLSKNNKLINMMFVL